MKDTSIIGPVHEKSKKGGSHIVALGNAEVARKPQTGRLIKWKHVDGEDKPCGTFIFRYRPLDVLQANGIAPRASPKPDKEPEVVKVEDVENDSDIEEIHALKEKLSLARTRRAEKRKLDGKNSTASKRVKMEKMNLSGHFQPGEVIDLTSD